MALRCNRPVFSTRETVAQFLRRSDGLSQIVYRYGFRVLKFRVWGVGLLLALFW